MAGRENDDIYARIEQGVDDFFETDRFKEYLKCMSCFHDYSDRNILLIHSQMPRATRVAGYQTWKEVGRQVKHGEKGIRILCPVNVYVDEPTDRTDEHGNQIIEKRPVTRFVQKSVFDISQTKGRELPQLVSELTGDVPGFDKLFAAICRISEYNIVVDDIGVEAKGLCDPAIRTIFIKPDMSQAQTLKTAVHELFHSRVHTSVFSDKSRKQCEIEAEAAAYVVCDHFGLDTSDYSFGYVAGWSSGVDHETRRRCIRGIHRDAASIISALENALEIQKINGNSIEEAEDIIKQQTVSKLSDAGVRAEDINIKIYSRRPEEKKEVIMYLVNEYYSYQASMKVTGLTMTEIQGIIEKGEQYQYLNNYLETYGAVCELYEAGTDIDYDMSYDLGNNRLFILKPEKTEGVSAMLEYKGEDKEDRMFTVLNDAAYEMSGAEVTLNPVKQELPREPYTERLEKYENLGYDSTWPMVGITYSNVQGTPHYNMNISEAVRFVNRLDEDTVNDPGKYMKLSIRYTYNDWQYEHVQNLEFGKGRINFIDYLNLPVNIANHLKSHANLIEMCKKAEAYAPDTTYGQEYGDRMQEWACYCRMELNHNSDMPVIPRPPLLDDLYNINNQGMRIDR